MEYETVIGLEVHAELATRSKMFCSCAVVDPTLAAPNSSVCPVCSGMPGVLPVVNQKAVEYALRVALALGCTVARTSLFARKNYFYPDLPKGYQISQYEYPLAQSGILPIPTRSGERSIRIRRVHLEEDTGKLTHVAHPDGKAQDEPFSPSPFHGSDPGEVPPPSPSYGEGRGEVPSSYTLVDLNRAGVPLLEIVSEPDLFTLDEVRSYAYELRAILRWLGVNSGDLEKGAIRFEANVSIRPQGTEKLGTRTEIKNLNSFRAMERAVAYEIERQQAVLNSGGTVRQETVGWNEETGETYSQRSKEDAHDYRYFPEPDLPPLVVEEDWLARVRNDLPELPRECALRFQQQYGITAQDARVLTSEKKIAGNFEQCVRAAPNILPQTVANWINGEIFAWINQSGSSIDQLKVTPAALAELLTLLAGGDINQSTAKTVLAEMLESGKSSNAIVSDKGLKQVSDADLIARAIEKVLQENPKELASYLAGKNTLVNWFFGQAMRTMGGTANPQVVRSELEKQLKTLRKSETV